MKITIKCEECGIEFTIDKPDGVTVEIPGKCQYCPKKETVDNAFLRCCGNCGSYSVLKCPWIHDGKQHLTLPLPSSVCSKWVPGEKGEVLG